MLNVNDRVKHADADASSIPAYREMRGTVLETKGEMALVRWDCDGESDKGTWRRMDWCARLPAGMELRCEGHVVAAVTSRGWGVVDSVKVADYVRKAVREAIFSLDGVPSSGDLAREANRRLIENGRLPVIAG